MTTFVRLLGDKDKATNLRASCGALRAGQGDPRLFDVDQDLFCVISGSPFAYSISGNVRNAFRDLRSVSDSGIAVAEGLNTTNNERFLRLTWETRTVDPANWVLLAKGGEHSRYYADLHLVVNWRDSGSEMKAVSRQTYGSETKRIYGQDYYFHSGLTYSQRTQKGLSFRAFPKGAIFNVKGPVLIANDPHPLALLAITNSSCFRHLVELQTSFGSYNVGYLQKTPLPENREHEASLAELAWNAWRSKRTLDTVVETSHAFALPATLRTRLSEYNSVAIEKELARIQARIDDIAFELYGFSEADRAAVQANQDHASEHDGAETDDDNDDDDNVASIDDTLELLSWAVGVAFGRFDWRLATGERPLPAEPGPFDPLPARSPGMLLEGADPFHAHNGILVDDSGHPHDLARLAEQVLERVSAPEVPGVREWLQHDFFDQHLKQYSRSRRKAPIYWPLSTASGSYTLWVYYPSLSSQTLYTAVNDFVEPKLKQVGEVVAVLRTKGGDRSRADERTLEEQQDLEQELRELRDELLRLAPGYKPSHDDGVQITAAPLWSLFRHKAWQKVLKTTCEELQAGEYDWAHLAMAYWPNRVREKCRRDKSLAIAHELEALYIEPGPAGPEKATRKGPKR